jgi:uncharacterized protein YgiM (DUF1202 family)
MPNWEELKALRTHRTIMTYVVIALIAFLILTPRHFLSKGITTSNDIEKARVNAKSGLKIRETPNLTSNIITTVPYYEYLKILDKTSNPDYIDGVSGNWYKVEYQNTVGYAWSIYIDE